MKFLGVFRRVLEDLDKGNVIRTAVVLALRILGILTVLAGIFVTVELLRASFTLPVQGIIGGLLFAIVILAASAALLETYFYRAASVGALGESAFTVMPVVSLLFRLLGEVYAIVGVAAAVGGCLFIWFSGLSPGQVLPGVEQLMPFAPLGGTFLGGVVFLVWLLVVSFLALLAFYFLAELVVVVVDIATNVRSLVKQARPGPA
jgi:hypothetical protein